MNKIKVGIVGLGFVAQNRHIPALMKLRKKVTINAVCDLNKNLAEKFAKSFGIPRIYTKPSDMLSKEDLDIVDICTPPQTHASLAIEAMEKGCNIILEKPMATSVKDCDDIIRTSKKNDVKLSVLHNQRFYPPFMKAEQIVKEGVIGKLMGLRILSLTNREEYMVHKNHWVHKLPGGIIGETGPHEIHMALIFLDNVKDVEVYAQKTLEFPWVLYDYYNIQLKGKSTSGSIVISHAGDYNVEEVDLIGTKGMIRMDLHSMTLVRYGKKNLKLTTLALSSLSVASQIIKETGSNILSVLFKKSMLGHDIFMSRFIDSILNDDLVPVTPEEGRETVRLMEMILKKLKRK
ncbi:MAG: Gfo/Idh/MocA family protein [Candidatus Lokiarchaeia archaeon]